VKRSFKRADTTGGRIRFAEVDSSPVDAPEWLSQVNLGKATTVVSVHPQSIFSAHDDEDDFGDAIPQPVYVPNTAPANDAHREPTPPRATHEAHRDVPPKRETIPPTGVQAAALRRSEIPRAPKALDTLVDELIPRADEEAVSAIASALEELSASRARLLIEAEDDLFTLAKLVAERVIGRELRSDPKLVRNLVREGVAALSSGDTCTVRLGRFYSGVVEDVRVAVMDMAMDVSVVVDPALANYGCVIESQWGRVDESVDGRLRTLLDQLDAMRVRT
jgi:Flagellar assembly protein FliH